MFSSKAQPDGFGREGRRHGVAALATIGAISLFINL